MKISHPLGDSGQAKSAGEAGGRKGAVEAREFPKLRVDVHINGSEGTVGDGAADGTGERESRVETNAAELGSGGDSGLLDDSVDLGRSCLSSHCDGM